MGRLLNNRTYIIIGIIIVCIALAFSVRSCLTKREVTAIVSPLNVELGSPIAYADSTRGADTWLWEFGNGDSSDHQKGEYTYTQAGRYQIRLTVDGNYVKKIIVNVRSAKQDEDEHLIKIEAPKTALQDEYIIFRGDGTSNEWRWEFGETGTVDAKEKTAIYKYSLPGTYEVLLTTEDTKYPIRHTIEITPQYSESDSTDIETMIGNDIKLKLQAIVDQKPFNTNYNYVMNSYLCNNPNTQVIINNSKRNDFYSYCQGLRIIGRKQTVIENVFVELDQEKETCVKKIIVIQTDTN